LTEGREDEAARLSIYGVDLENEEYIMIYKS